MIVSLIFSVVFFTIVVATRRHLVHAHIGSDHRSIENDQHISDANNNIQLHNHHSNGSRDLRGLSDTSLARNTNRNSINQRCATNTLTSDEKKESIRVVRKWMQNTNLRAQQRVTINVNVYFHIITAANSTIGKISKTDVQNQLDVLNNAYRPYGFSFTLIGTTRTDNSQWYYALVYSQDEYDMKIALRVGDASILNVYFNDASGVFGYATLPSSYNYSSIADGVVVRSGTIPGGNAIPNTEGKTLVHEVGHWLGLLHTFEVDLSSYTSLYYLMNILGLRGDCHYNSDGVLDTPKQRSFTVGCPASRDSCPLQIGLDPIHNYMDYSDDRCYNEFTTGQMNRMLAMWNEYRAVK
jgi:Pregnancy-associated plasma protein-A